MYAESNYNHHILINAGISNKQLNHWYRLQDDLKQDDIVVSGFKPTLTLKPIIQLYEAKKTGNGRLWSKDLNTQMVQYILQKGAKTVHKQYIKRIKELGILVPVNDIDTSNFEELNSMINILGYWIKQHSFLDFANAIRDKIKNPTANQLPLPVLQTFYLLEDYYQMIYTQQHLINNVRNIGGWSWNMWDTKNLGYRLYTEQFMILITIHLEFLILGSSGITNTLNLEAEASDEVRIVWTKVKEKLNTFFAKNINIDGDRFSFLAMDNFQEELSTLQSMDRKNQIAYRLLEDMRNPYPNVLARHRDIYEKANGNKSFIEKVSKIFSRKTIFNTIQSINDSTKVNTISLFKNADRETHPYDKYIDNLDKEDIEILVSTVVNILTPHQKNTISKSVDESLQVSMRHLLNKICHPIYKWSTEDMKDEIPEIILAQNEDLKAVFKYQSFVKQQEKKEAKILEENILKLQETFSKSALDNLIYKMPKLKSYDNQKKWELAIEAQEAAIQHRRAFRLRKMKELGITEKLVSSEHMREVYLNEMIAVEEEIRRFVPFVTGAFLSALPSRRTVEFDTYRHNYDGIEFDPETTMDPEKWMRGHVMKTLKHKLEKGEVTQVNSFCLDLSGSMFHERMRNLFKILYLLVLGLESRKSFDSFHFFSNSFLPGVNFRGNYTQRDLLFRVLHKISHVVGDNILYGGLEGTNISDGINGCKIRLENFVKKLKKQNPSLNVSCSIFVITDGEPSMGIKDLDKLNNFIQEIRDESNIAIKGIYIKSMGSLRPDFISRIFGEDEYVETSNFEEGVHELVSIMTKTYRQQREEFKWSKKRKSLNLDTPSFLSKDK